MTTESQRNLLAGITKKVKSTPSGPEEAEKTDTDKLLAKALNRVSTAATIKVLSTPEPPPPPPPPPDPTAMAKLTIETARAMSSEEREDRHKVEKESSELLGTFDQQRKDAEEKQRLAEEKAREANFERQKDFLGFQIEGLKKAAEELKHVKEGGSPANVAQRTNELADAIESVKKLVQVMAPQTTGTPQSGIQHFLSDLKALDEARELLMGRKQESPMVNMSNLSQMPAQYAIELRKIELEDARIREIRKEELKIESQKKEAQEGLMGMIMGICGSFLNSVGGVAAPVAQNTADQPAQPPPQPEPEMVRFDCRDCGQTMMIPKAQASKVQLCPFCGPKVIEREVVREVDREGPRHDEPPQADV